MKLPEILTNQPFKGRLLMGWALVLTLSIALGIGMEKPAMLVIPVIFLGTLLAIQDIRKLYWLMWMTVPLSTELEFNGGFSTDFPVEPLMILVSGVMVLWVAQNVKQISFRILMHPVTLALLAHVGWIALSTITSTDSFVSVKFLLAKLWYIVPFYFLSYALLRSEKSIKIWFWSVMVPLILTVCVVLVRHGMVGFSFDTINQVLSPFYRNHVDYGLIMGVLFPFVFVLGRKWMSPVIYWSICALLLIALYFTYTRAAYVGLGVAVGGVLLVRWKVVRYACAGVLVFILIAAIGLSRNNKYIDYAPNYYKTITHHNFSNLLEATYKLEDISTVERFYRWIAAFYMVKEKPVTGFGPNGFVPHYRPYTDDHFLTYVSDNPEQSGVHNYFLMTTVEQGIPGLIFFVLLLFITLMRIEWLYHKLRPGFNKNLCISVIGSIFFILFALLLNDMIETDKVGTIFFLNLAFIAILERNARQSGDWIETQPVISRH